MAAPVRGHCTVISLPHPIARAGGGTATLRLSVSAGMALVWTDGTTDTYAPGAHGPCVSAYDGTAVSVDGHADVWLILASHGTANLWLCKELDFENAPTLLGALAGVTAGVWAPLYRVDGDSIEKMDQVQPDLSKFVELDPAAGPPQEGDLIYSHSGKWELLHVGTQGNLLASTGTDPAWTSFTPAEGDLVVYTSGQWQRLGMGATNTLLTAGPGADPGWQPLSLTLAALLANPGQLVEGAGGGSLTLLNPGADRQILMVKAGPPVHLEWDTIANPLGPAAGYIPLISPAAGTYRALILDASGNPGWAFITVP